MVNMTLAIPEDLHEIMKRHTDIKWSEVARRALRDYAEKLDKLDKMLQESKLTDEDVTQIDHNIKKSMAKKYRKYLK
jgi:Arc/MetJ-type ribon-helix-helix transcriptional regulator